MFDYWTSIAQSQHKMWLFWKKLHAQSWALSPRSYPETWVMLVIRAPVTEKLDSGCWTLRLKTYHVWNIQYLQYLRRCDFHKSVCHKTFILQTQMVPAIAGHNISIASHNGKEFWLAWAPPKTTILREIQDIQQIFWPAVEGSHVMCKPVKINV